MASSDEAPGTMAAAAAAASAPAQEQEAQIIVHWLDKSRAQRIIWLLEECRAQYTVKIYKRGADAKAPEELKSVHALGKSPVVEFIPTGVEKGIVVAESANIAEYIVAHFGSSLAPPQWQAGREGQVGGETEAWLRYRYYMHYVEGSLMGLYILAYLMQRIRTAPMPFFIRPIIRRVPEMLESQFLTPSFKTHYAFLESQLESDYLCGDALTAADVTMLFGLEFGGALTGLTKEKYPRLAAYVERCQGREAYKRAIERMEKETGEKFEMNL